MIVKDHMPALRKSLTALSAQRVLVGIPSEQDLRKPEPGEKASPFNNAAIGYVMENGAPDANIPPRPWLVPGVATVQEAITKRFGAAAKSVLDGRSYNITTTLNAVGLIAQNGVRSKITNGPFTPLAPATLAARRSRGRKGDRPLVDTGQFRAAVTYVIRPAGAMSHA